MGGRQNYILFNKIFLHLEGLIKQVTVNKTDYN